VGQKVEAQMDARMFSDVRGLANITLKELIDWYCEVIGRGRPFGKNKTSVLNMWRRDHGAVHPRQHGTPQDLVTLEGTGQAPY
jgi:hypothetical protein